MLASLLFIFPTHASPVEEPQDYLTVVDFDSGKQPEFYATGEDGKGSNAFGSLTADAESGNCMQLPNIRYVYKNDGGTAWSSSVRISNTQGDGMAAFSAGTVLHMAVDVKVQDLKFGSKDTSKIYVGLLFAAEGCNSIGGNYWSGVTEDVGIRKYYNNKKLVTVGRVDPADGTWQTVRGVVTVPAHEETEYPTLVIYSEAKDGGQSSNSEVFVDNIAVCEYTWESAVSTEIDFDRGEQPRFYWDTTGKSGSFAYGSLVANVDEPDNGNSLKLDMISRTSVTPSDSWGPCCPSAVILSNREGTAPINFADGSEVDISVDLKINALGSCSDTTKSKLFVGLVFAAENCGVIGGTPGTSSHYGLNKYATDHTLLKVGQIDATTADWQTIRGTVTVPAHTLTELPTVFLYSEGDAVRKNDISIDNIKATQRTWDANASARVDFDRDNQPAAYADTTGVAGSYANGKLVTDAEHGNVLQMPSIRYIHKNDAGTAWPSSVRLVDASGNQPVNFQSGELLQVSVDVKVTDLKFGAKDTSKLYVGLAFSADNCNSIGGNWYNGVSGNVGLRKCHAEGKLIQIAKIDATNTDWQTLCGVITVPAHTLGEAPALVVYSLATDGGYAGDSAVYVDNIVASNADINGDGQWNICDLVCLNEHISAGETAKKDDVNVDGKVDAEDLTKIRQLLLFADQN